jgi:hypothetical protein
MEMFEPGLVRLNAYLKFKFQVIVLLTMMLSLEMIYLTFSLSLYHITPRIQQ